MDSDPTCNVVGGTRRSRTKHHDTQDQRGTLRLSASQLPRLSSPRHGAGSDILRSDHFEEDPRGGPDLAGNPKRVERICAGHSVHATCGMCGSDACSRSASSRARPICLRRCNPGGKRERRQSGRTGGLSEVEGADERRSRRQAIGCSAASQPDRSDAGSLN